MVVGLPRATNIFLSKYLNNFYSKFNYIFHPKSAGSKFILATILSQKKCLSINILSGILVAFFEGISLSIIFLLLSVISQNEGREFNWDTVFIVGKFKFLIDWLNNLSFTNIFIGLILCAVLAQIFQSLVKYLNL